MSFEGALIYASGHVLERLELEPHERPEGHTRDLPANELWLFTVTDPLTGKRRRTNYRLTLQEARERYVDPEPVQGSLERREVNERAIGHGQTLGAPTHPGG